MGALASRHAGKVAKRINLLNFWKKMIFWIFENFLNFRIFWKIRKFGNFWNFWIFENFWKFLKNFEFLDFFEKNFFDQKIVNFFFPQWSMYEIENFREILGFFVIFWSFFGKKNFRKSASPTTQKNIFLSFLRIWI